MRDRTVAGTGFFVAPGQIVTCAHVVQGLGNNVNVRWNKATFYGEVSLLGNPNPVPLIQPGDSTLPDLALIVLKESDQGPIIVHPCVHLSDEMPQDGDRFYSFGHAEGEYVENGESLTVNYEGVAVDALDREMLSLKDGQVRSGMSGSPLLNQRTGSVCGVLFASKNAGASLGGRAIPVRYVFAMFSGLEQAHNKYHETNAVWTGLWNGIDPAIESARQPAASTPEPPPIDPAVITAFQIAKGRLGVSAHKMWVEKRPNLFGGSTVLYRIEDLRSDYILNGVEVFIRSAAGLVGTPLPADDASKALMDWQPENNTRDLPAHLDSKIKEVHSIRGKFRFKSPLPVNRSITFTFAVEILNQYALSDWEFHHMYSRKAAHFDGELLNRPLEYFPQIVWFPVESLHVTLALPRQLQTQPFLKAFQCVTRERIAMADVLCNGYVQMHPLDKSDGTPGSKQRWVEDTVEDEYRAGALKVDPDGIDPAELEIAYPRVGNCYSLDWLLPVTFAQLIRDAEAIREKLLEHRKVQRKESAAEPFHRVHDVFRGFAEDLRKIYSVRGQDNFEVTLMTYNDSACKLEVVDGLRNGAALRQSDWDFALPFGAGLAGACFREGNLAIRWSYKEQQRDKDKSVNYYLPIEGRDEHQAMLIVPIDHPALPLASDLPTRQENSGGFSQRAQQLIALVIIGSSAPDSKLLDLSTNTQTQKDADISKPIDELASIATKANTLGAELAKAFGLWQ